ncbi:MAG: DUF433 domain-containing protein [Limisphaerales bacterium]
MTSDPRICRGQPAFRGTRILVADVLERLLGVTHFSSGAT